MKTVFVNGTFDILHMGHLYLLNYAKSLAEGGQLIVAIDSDRRIKELKGKTRPINGVTERSMMLSNLKAVDKVCVFDSDEELRNIIKRHNVDIMVKGSDYRDKSIIGAEYCKEIVFFEVMHGYSTTRKIQSIADR